LKWTPSNAGKTGRCKCGATIRVPDAIDPAASHVPTGGRASMSRPGRAGVSDQDDADSTDLLHELWIPTGVLLVGFLAIVAWLAFQGWLSAGAVITALFVAGTIMVIKTVCLSLMAASLARRSGGSLGNPLSTILKIAGLIVVLDASILWAWSGMVATGAITQSGQFYVIKTLVVLLLGTLVVAALVTQFIFGLHGDEANLFSKFVAGGNLLLNILLLVGLAVAAGAVKRAAEVSAASPPADGATSPARIGPIPVSIAANSDRRIAARISRGAPFVMEGRDWTKSFLMLNKVLPVKNLIGQMYDAGATKVYIDVVGDRKTPTAIGPAEMYVELPAPAEQRNACFSVAARFQDQNPAAAVSPSMPTSARFLEILLNP
jgi:hypothetical protein